MANSRDFTGKNRKFTGTKGIVAPKGTTGERVGSESGELRFNTTIELMEYYDGNQWKPIDAPPSISSISTSDAQGTNNILNADGSTLHTITITGGNFGIGVTVKFIGNTGTEYAAGNVTRVSNSSITCKTTSSMGTTDDPYDILVTNVSGLSATLEDAFSFNAAPVFVTASGSLGNAFNTIAISGSTLNASATDAEGNTITYTITSGSLPAGLTIGSSTGLITGTPSGNTAGVFTFTVQAATTEGITTRVFSITAKDVPTGGTITTSGGFRIHTFTSSSSFVVPTGTTLTNVEYLVIAGGGGGGNTIGGGGGAGGYRCSVPGESSGNNAAAESRLTLTANTYTVTVGGGGPGGPATGTSGTGHSNGTQGENSVFGSITSTGGGFGSKYDTGTAGGSGGSGGGGAEQNAGGAGTAGQGTSGAAGDGSILGGGGGGASASPSPTKNGGAGISSSITGSSVARAGGGGGGSRTGNTPGTATAGGSNGAIGTGNVTASNAENFKGGGGGGGGWESGAGGAGGNGGSGTVIVRYQL